MSTSAEVDTEGKEQRKKLLDAYYAGALPLEQFKEEQDRLSQENQAAEGHLSAALATFEQVEATLKEAIALAGDCQAAYRSAKPHERRLMNQAFFKRVFVTEDGITGHEWAEPFASLMAVSETEPEAVAEATTTEPGMSLEALIHAAQPNRTTYQRKRPSRWAGAFSGVGLKETVVVEAMGIEPTNLLHAMQALYQLSYAPEGKRQG